MQKSFALFIIACFLIVLAAGCTSSAGNSAPATPTTTAVSVTSAPVTTQTTIPPTQITTKSVSSSGSVAGSWAYDETTKIKINSDGSSLDNVGNTWSTGTWHSTGENTFVVTADAGGLSGDWVYDPNTNTIYQVLHPHLIYSLYSGAIEKFCPSDVTYNECMDIKSHASYPSGYSSSTNSKSLQYSGSGDDTQSFTVSGGGGFIVSGSYTGSGNFIVHITDSYGNVQEFVFNEIGSYSGKKIVHLNAGKYYLEVTASGPWNIGISTAS